MSNRKKNIGPTSTVTGVTTNGTTAEFSTIQSNDDVLYHINVTVLTAGSVTPSLQTSPDGTTWYPVPEAIGKTDAITAVGAHTIAARAPVGQRTRLSYLVDTGPATFTVIPEASKRGHAGRN